MRRGSPSGPCKVGSAPKSTSPLPHPSLLGLPAHPTTSKSCRRHLLNACPLSATSLVRATTISHLDYGTASSPVSLLPLLLQPTQQLRDSVKTQPTHVPPLLSPRQRPASEAPGNKSQFLTLPGKIWPQTPPHSHCSSPPPHVPGPLHLLFLLPGTLPPGTSMAFFLISFSFVIQWYFLRHSI